MIVTEPKIKSIITGSYPIRYMAFDNHKTIVEHENVISGQFEKYQEAMAYYNEIEYKAFGKDYYGYCFITIASTNGKFMVEIESEYPDHLRKQNNSQSIHETYQEAKEQALKQIGLTEDWLTSKWYLKQPVTTVDRETWEERGQWYKKVYEDGTKVVRLIGDHQKHKFNIDYRKKENKQTEYFQIIIKEEL
ncbi:hypothetical protein [Siminovitchia fordii]|uniref:Uncharacterized protein n=1 Tax=Siminovitchia fordii TaxID=254759 RepID=A0ABQ4KA74_9BACI|nr:hypothetical protein [Siminovitchia fordii]GIN22619.1 hypothetical protein J1TS3_37530 [Siminovitchia fordii]